MLKKPTLVGDSFTVTVTRLAVTSVTKTCSIRLGVGFQSWLAWTAMDKSCPLAGNGESWSESELLPSSPVLISLRTFPFPPSLDDGLSHLLAVSLISADSFSDGLFSTLLGGLFANLSVMGPKSLVSSALILSPPSWLFLGCCGPELAMAGWRPGSLPLRFFRVGTVVPLKLFPVMFPFPAIPPHCTGLFAFCRFSACMFVVWLVGFFTEGKDAAAAVLLLGSLCRGVCPVGILCFFCPLGDPKTDWGAPWLLLLVLVESLELFKFSDATPDDLHDDDDDDFKSNPAPLPDSDVDSLKSGAILPCGGLLKEGEGGPRDRPGPMLLRDGFTAPLWLKAPRLCSPKGSRLALRPMLV